MKKTLPKKESIDSPQQDTKRTAIRSVQSNTDVHVFYLMQCTVHRKTLTSSLKSFDELEKGWYRSLQNFTDTEMISRIQEVYTWDVFIFLNVFH